MPLETEARETAPKPMPLAKFGRIAYRASGAFLLFLVAAVGGGAIGLALAGRDADGLEGLGAALMGMFMGGIVGLIAAVVFLFARLPGRVLMRWIVIGVLMALFFAAVWIQEIYD